MLLETAPGHATRCADSAVHRRASPRLKQRAASTEGVARPATSGSELERLNVGRLRHRQQGHRAATATALSAVDEERQRDEGMFMVGEVAALRYDVTTVAALHDAVSAGAADLLAPAPPSCEPPGRGRGRGGGRAARRRCDIAIVGMACMFPGRRDLAAFWANILAGADAVTEVPPSAGTRPMYYDAATRDGAGARPRPSGAASCPTSPSTRCATASRPPRSPRIEPVQLLALEVARAGPWPTPATRDRAVRPRPHLGGLRRRGGQRPVQRVRRCAPCCPRYVGDLPPALDEQLPRLTEDSFPGMLANVIAGRIANRLDLGGANYTVDAACASSLAAVDVACKELVAGTSDVVLCGGADLHNGINDYLLFSSVHALSPDGPLPHLRRSSADGIALGEGVGVRRAQAAGRRRARRRPRSTPSIKGVGGSSDGRALGLTAPAARGPARARWSGAYAQGRRLTRRASAWSRRTAPAPSSATAPSWPPSPRCSPRPAPSRAGCALGSVKSQIGHTKCAAGLAGLIKTALALHHGVLPPTLQHRAAQRRTGTQDSSPFALPRRGPARGRPSPRRVAGVSAFGFGGTNFHAVLRAYDRSARARAGLDAWPAELFVFRGKDAASASAGRRSCWPAGAAGRRMAAAGPRARRRTRQRSAAVAASLSASRCSLGPRATDARLLAPRRPTACDDRAGAGISAARPQSGPATPQRRPRSLAFLFPGQGSQRPGMLADLFVAFPRARSG